MATTKTRVQARRAFWAIQYEVEDHLRLSHVDDDYEVRGPGRCAACSALSARLDAEREFMF